MEAGTIHLILTDPTPSLTCLTPCWIVSIFIDLTISPWNFIPIGPSHSPESMTYFLWIYFAKIPYSPPQTKKIWMLFVYIFKWQHWPKCQLQKETPYSDAFKGRRSHRRISDLAWITQPEITSSQILLWQKALNSTVAKQSTQRSKNTLCHLRTRLGPWTGAPPQKWPSHYDFS